MTAPDRYACFAELCRHEQEGTDFVILTKASAASLLVMAPHGGGIEPGTVDLAHAIAGDDHAFYAFKGIKASGNAALHITSNRFDEPRALRMARRAEWVLTIHGCREPGAVIFVGGRDGNRRQAIGRALQEAGFDARESERPGLRGINPNNICNRGYSGRGVQLELSDGLRRQMFDHLRRRTGRRKTEVFYRFVSVVRDALAAMSPRPLPTAAPGAQAASWRIASDPRDRLKALAIRAIVFMEEQAVAFAEEFDAGDDEALHLLGEIAGEPAACGRLRFDDGWAKLERIAVRRVYRGRGLAHRLIDRMLAEAARRGYPRCRLHAQAHLVDLYRRHGFIPCGDVFYEAGIPHRLMTRDKATQGAQSRI
ncbi:MAG: GNAT family N-acetyltransferase [Deltaproteobacteria bacterium]|nr:GNAT family N-acetyltransferase [Deltaproteobacteria bacterium]